MPSLVQRFRTSLRARLFAVTVALVATALAIAAVAFERSARSVIVDAVHSHLEARVKEVHDAVQRFQRERALTVRNWAEAEAMQMSLDSGDPKFAEDYLRRVIQDLGGTLSVVALLGPDGDVRAAVRAAPQSQQRGYGILEARGFKIELPAVKEASEGDRETVATIAPLSRVLRGGADVDVLVLVSPIKDFAGDLVGFVAATLTRETLAGVLADVTGRDTSYRPILFDAERRLVLSLPNTPREALEPVLGLPAPATAGALETLAPEAGDELLGVRTPPAPEPPGWSTLMVVGEKVALGRLYWLRGLLATFFAVVLVGAGVLSIGALRQASAPLSDVAASMTRVASGDLSTRVRTEYSDELGHLTRSFNTMVSEVERSRDELQRTEALRREVQIAHQIQTAILPVSPAVKGYEIAARMKPADNVGGDLYDILAFDEDTFWVIVGDVSGHGINSGLVMMMAQAAAYGAIADNPRCSPADVISAVNRVVHENVRQRMKRDDYLTLMAARHEGDGRFVAAGAHQPIFVARADGRVEIVDSPGPWVGLTPGVPPGIEEYGFEVGRGDLLCLITDGVIEATNAGGDLFGEERLSATLARQPGDASAPQVLGAVFAAVQDFTSLQADDMTTVVLRRKT